MPRPQSDVRYHVYPQANTSIWWVWYRQDNNGIEKIKRISTASFSTGPLSLKDYTQEQAQKIANQATGVTTDKSAATQRFSAIWANEYMRDRIEHEGLSARTLNWYRDSLAKFRGFYGDLYPLDQFHARDIYDFQRYALDSGCKPVSINTYCRGMQGIYARMVKQGYIDRNPFAEFERLRENKSKKHLSLAELRILLDKLSLPACDTDRSSRYISRRLVRMLAYTGLRRQEVLIIERSDVDLKNMRLLVTNIKSEDKRKRWIAVSEKIVEDVNFFLANFDSSYDGRPGFPFFRCHPDTLTHWCKEHLIEAGLPEYHTHNLRHTFATLALENGWSIRELQRYLDHSDTSVTEIYSHDTASFRAPDLGV